MVSLDDFTETDESAATGVRVDFFTQDGLFPTILRATVLGILSGFVGMVVAFRDATFQVINATEAGIDNLFLTLENSVSSLMLRAQTFAIEQIEGLGIAAAPVSIVSTLAIVAVVAIAVNIFITETDE